MNDNIDIHTGLDFELAKGRANDEAGRLFRQYLALQATGDATAAAEAKAAYALANQAARNLAPATSKRAQS